MFLNSAVSGKTLAKPVSGKTGSASRYAAERRKVRSAPMNYILVNRSAFH